MKLPRRKFLHLAAGAAALPAVARAAWEQASPSRPVRIIVRFPAGGATDILARITGQWLSERLGQQFIIKNRAGAGGNIGTEAVVKAPPDGYTLLQIATPNGLNAALYQNLNFNFVRDIAPVIGAMRTSYAMVVHPSVPADTVSEFIAYAKANPGKISFASVGNGTTPHVGGRTFQDDDWHRHGSRALSRRCARAYRSHRRPGSDVLCPHGRVDRVHQGRQAAGVGGDDDDALGLTARSPPAMDR
jgi:tripartite-type tricarboxylate transporter receptor subunit TctC